MSDQKNINIRKILIQANSYALQSNPPDLDLITAFQTLFEAVNATLDLIQDQNETLEGLRK